MKYILAILLLVSVSAHARIIECEGAGQIVQPEDSTQRDRLKQQGWTTHENDPIYLYRLLNEEEKSALRPFKVDSDVITDDLNDQGYRSTKTTNSFGEPLELFFNQSLTEFQSFRPGSPGFSFGYCKKVSRGFFRSLSDMLGWIITPPALRN